MDEKEKNEEREALQKFIKSEVEKNLPKKMTDGEAMQEARETRDGIRQNSLWAEQRSCTIADEYIRLQVQIATLIFAFASLFLNYFTPENFVGIGPGGIFIMKLAFAISIFSLLASLAFGLFYLKVNEGFWDSMLRQRIIRYKKWEKVARRETSFEEADAYQDGTSLGKGNTVSPPDWMWVLQTICLGLGIVILFILAIVYLFARHSV